MQCLDGFLYMILLLHVWTSQYNNNFFIVTPWHGDIFLIFRHLWAIDHWWIAFRIVAIVQMFDVFFEINQKKSWPPQKRKKPNKNNRIVGYFEMPYHSCGVAEMKLAVDHACKSSTAAWGQSIYCKWMIGLNGKLFCWIRENVGFTNYKGASVDTINYTEYVYLWLTMYQWRVVSINRPYLDWLLPYAVLTYKLVSVAKIFKIIMVMVSVMFSLTIIYIYIHIACI